MSPHTASCQWFMEFNNFGLWIAGNIVSQPIVGSATFYLRRSPSTAAATLHVRFSPSSAPLGCEHQGPL